MKTLPKGWKEVKLSEVGKIVTGKTPSKDNPDDWGSKYNFITPTDIKDDSKFIDKTNRFISEKGKNRFQNMILDEYSIIVTCIGSDMGKIIINKNKALTNQQINSIVVNTKFDKDFIYYKLKSEYKLLKRLAGSGSTMPLLNKSDFSNIKVILPESPDEQKAIANILSSLDKKIELLKEQNQTLETIAQTIFKEWFVDFNYPHVTGEMIDSEMGEIPKGWRVSNLKNISEVISKGTTPTKSDIEGLAESIPFLKVKDITDNGNIKYDSLEKIPFETHMTVVKRSQLKENDLLYSIAGTIGRIAILPIHLDNSNCNQALAFIRLKEKNTFLEYVHQWIQTTEIINKINSSIVQGVQANVSLTVLGNLSIIIPNDETLKNWHDVIKPIYKKILNNNFQLQTIIETKIILLPKLMMGKKRVIGFESD
ncbi:MAG: restriction endonuclease subunit S [Sulfuricurvum sp.]|nr:restriction endonuclease subunit S [Sulfuricurvum sp.]